jgi:GT2 family glycosyltransferase
MVMPDYDGTSNVHIGAPDSRTGQDCQPAQSKHYELQEQLEQKDRELQEALLKLAIIQSSFLFKLLDRYRRLRMRLLPNGTRRNHLYSLFTKAAHITLHEGPISVLRLAWRYLRRHGFKNSSLEDYSRPYLAWIERNEPKPEDFPRLRSEAESLCYKPFISIVMPTYNTDEVWLRAAIESVRRQIYPNWELCIADDGSVKPDVRRVLEEYRRRDERIKVIYLEKNQGISCASNAAMSLATGEFVGLLDHDDELAPWALLEVVKFLNQNPSLDLIYSDEDKVAPNGSRVKPFFKPDFSPDLLMSTNYICHFSVFRRLLFDKIGGFQKRFDGSQDHDLVLRLSEQSRKIAHIPRVLYHWRQIPGSVAWSGNAKTWAYEVSEQMLQESLERRRLRGKAKMLYPGIYKIRYEIAGTPLVSIIIPTRDKVKLLRRCIRSIRQKSTYNHYEIIVVDNCSTKSETARYLAEMSADPSFRVLSFNEPFNYSRLNNVAAKEARGDFLLFLNNDTEVISPDWLEEMLGHAQRPEVGAVGAKLLFPNGTIQHGGVIVGLGGVAGHAFYGMRGSEQGYMGLATVTRNCTAVTAACLMTRRSIFEEVGGFDEKLDVAYNDVDFCLKMIQRGYYIVYTPHAVLRHYESASRSHVQPERNTCYFRAKWSAFLDSGDPFYNPNLALDSSDFRINPNKISAYGTLQK